MEIIDKRSEFVAANDLAQEIADQNTRVGRANKEIKSDEYLAIALAGLKQEQIETIEAISDLTAPLPYEELYLSLEQKNLEVQELETQLANVQANVKEDQLAIQGLTKLVVEISPYASNQAESLSAKKIKELNSDTQCIQKKLDETIAEREAILGLLEIVTQAWPKPLLYEASIQKTETDEQYTDEIPTTPATEQKNRTIVKGYRHESHSVDAPTASQDIAFILQNLPGQIVEDIDLARMIYDEEVQDPTSEDAIKLRKRIRSLMFPKRVKISKTIPQLLEESNLALQYGRRRRQVDGQSVTSRIYRSFPIREEPKGTNMQENSEVTWDKTTSPELNERLPHLQKETAKLVEKVPHQGENKATQKWNEYREAVALSLANLIYFGVIINESEPVKISMIRMRSPSKKMGTKTAIERMISAKLLDHKIGDDDSISPELIVAMDLFNSHRDLLQGSRQKQAIDIIRNLIRPSLDIWDKYMSGQEI